MNVSLGCNIDWGLSGNRDKLMTDHPRVIWMTMEQCFFEKRLLATSQTEAHTCTL